VTLGKVFAETNLLPFQVYVFPIVSMNISWANTCKASSFPNSKLSIRGDGQQRCLPAQTFIEAAVSFLSELFALDEDIPNKASTNFLKTQLFVLQLYPILPSG